MDFGFRIANPARFCAIIVILQSLVDNPEFMKVFDKDVSPKKRDLFRFLRINLPRLRNARLGKEVWCNYREVEKLHRLFISVLDEHWKSNATTLAEIELRNALHGAGYEMFSTLFSGKGDNTVRDIFQIILSCL